MTDYENSEMTTRKHQEEKEKEKQKESVNTKENVEFNAVRGSVSEIKNRASSPQEQQNLNPELKVTSKQNEQLSKGGTPHEAKKKRIDHFVLEKDIIEFESAAANISDSLLRLEAEKMKLHTDLALAIATSVKVLRTAVNNILSCVVQPSVKDVNEEMQQLVHDLVQFIRNLKV